MKLGKLLLSSILLVGALNAQDIMQKSMYSMEEGMTKIQKGFLNNNVELIKEGSMLVKEGNKLFSETKVIKEYLPADKKHMANVASLSSQRIALDLNVLELSLDEKAYLNAANAYSDMLNACSKCHAIVRKW